MSGEFDMFFKEPSVVNRNGTFKRRGNSQVRKNLLTLMETPNRWAVVRTTTVPRLARTYASSLKLGRIEAPFGHWDFCSGGCEVFAKYLGPEGQENEI